MISLAFYLSILESEDDRDKLQLIYDKYYDTMMLTARKLVGVHQLEEDITHEAILKIIENIDKVDIDNEASTRCYVCTITRNLAMDWLRRNNKSCEPEEEETEEVIFGIDYETPLDRLISEDDYVKLVNCILSINRNYRDICYLKYVCGLKEYEIAKVLGISEKIVSVRIFRARRAIVRRMQKEEWSKL